MSIRYKSAEMAGPGNAAHVAPATTSRTTTTHRPRCGRPGWHVENSRTMHGVQIARCAGCGAVELRTEASR